MRQIILIAVFIISAHLSFARTQQAINSQSSIAYSDTATLSISDARQMLTKIMDVLGLQADFELREAKVNNVEASIAHRKRYILYNPSFINWINNATKDKWAAIALLAHEVGHHLNGHTIKKSGSKPALELEADEFAGFVLYKLGASLEQSQEVMKYIATAEATRTHPARGSRMIAIEKGWSRAANTKDNIAQAKK
jgi:hypothetical protein